jgi:GGDEF domain-containing protein
MGIKHLMRYRCRLPLDKTNAHTARGAPAPQFVQFDADVTISPNHRRFGRPVAIWNPSGLKNFSHPADYDSEAMPIVSIKRFLDTTSDAPLRQAVALLIEKLADGAAIESDPQVRNAFRAEIQQVQEALTPALAADNVLVLTQAAAAAQEIFSRRVSRTIEKKGADFQVIIRMLQESLAKVAGERAAAVEGFGRIGEELQRGTAFQNLQSLKEHLSGCLVDLRSEIERERVASRELIERLQTEIGSLRGPHFATGARQLDPSTELPTQKDCLAAIRQTIDSGVHGFAVVMVVNRVQRINARFGREAGDRMLCRFKEHAQKQFHASDRLFRWSGPAIVAIIERPAAFDLVRAQVKRMLELPLEENYEIGGRSVLIPISAAWSLMLLNSSADAIDKQIQTFIASQGGRDFV